MLELISRKINSSNSKRMSFEAYMELCLYAEEIGYYTSQREKIGKQGDFYTSSNIGSLMGEMLAEWIVKHYQSRAVKDQPLQLVEWGGGNGRLASQVLTRIRTCHPILYERTFYQSQEISPYHRAIQFEQLEEHNSCLKERTKDQVEQSFTVVWANELLDAFPCRRFRRHKNQLQELFITQSDEGLALEWQFADEEAVSKYSDLLTHVLEGQQFERSEHIGEWFKKVATSYSASTLLVIDYGAERAELLAPHRMNGTFVCYRQHQASDNPLAYPGEQDLTAHVDFTQVREHAELEGFVTLSYHTQKQFLIEAGILNQLQSHGRLDPFDPIVKRNRAIRQLLISDQMSELFKVYIAEKRN